MRFQCLYGWGRVILHPAVSTLLNLVMPEKGLLRHLTLNAIFVFVSTTICVMGYTKLKANAIVNSDNAVCKRLSK